jgi:hypothetical protein
LCNHGLHNRLKLTKKTKATVSFMLHKDANVHAREYQIYLPSKLELQRKLIEWTGEREAGDR